MECSDIVKWTINLRTRKRKIISSHSQESIKARVVKKWLLFGDEKEVKKRNNKFPSNVHIKKYKSKHSKMRMRRGGEKETKEKFMTGRRRRDVLKGDNHFYDFVK